MGKLSWKNKIKTMNINKNKNVFIKNLTSEMLCLFLQTLKIKAHEKRYLMLKRRKKYQKS